MRDAFKVGRVCIPDISQRNLIDDSISKINLLLEESKDTLLQMQEVSCPINPALQPFSLEVVISQYMGIGWKVRVDAENIYIRPKTSAEINRE